MKIFKELETKLNGLNKKIELKTQLINDFYHKDVKSINKIYSNNKEEICANGLNQHREILINKLQDNLIKEMQQFNSSHKLSQYLIYYRKSYKSLELVCGSYKFNQPLDLNKVMNKYCDLVLTKKRIDLNKIDVVAQRRLRYEYINLNLSSQKCLLVFNESTWKCGNPSLNYIMIIVNKMGDVLCKRVLEEVFDCEQTYPVIKTTFSNIMIAYKKETSAVIEMYDFNLSLIYRHVLNYDVNIDTMQINNNEVAFYSNESLKLRFLNIENLKSSFIGLQHEAEKKIPFYIYDPSRYKNYFANFNDESLYFIRKNGRYFDLIYIMNRATGATKSSIKIDTDGLWAIKFDCRSHIYFYDEFEDVNRAIKIYSKSGEFMYYIELSNKLKTVLEARLEFSFVCEIDFLIRDCVLYALEKNRNFIEFNQY